MSIQLIVPFDNYDKFVLACGVFTIVSVLLGRLMLFYLKRGTLYMATEFSVRMRRHLRGEYPETAHKGACAVIRFLANKTYYDIFELRRLNHRRRFDLIKSKLDALFYIDEGAEVFFDDLADQVSYIGSNEHIDWPQFFTYVFSKNPIFNHLFGLFSIDLVNKFYRTMPIFVVLVGGSFSFIAPHWQNILFITLFVTTILLVINLLLNTERYDMIVSKTFAWSMFLLWSAQKDQHLTALLQDRIENVAESSELLDSDLQVCQAMEETFALVAKEEDIPELPDLPQVA